jgi:hypothetical protein
MAAAQAQEYAATGVEVSRHDTCKAKIGLAMSRAVVRVMPGWGCRREEGAVLGVLGEQCRATLEAA